MVILRHPSAGAVSVSAVSRLTTSCVVSILSARRWCEKSAAAVHVGDDADPPQKFASTRQGKWNAIHRISLRAPRNVLLQHSEPTNHLHRHATTTLVYLWTRRGQLASCPLPLPLSLTPICSNLSNHRIEFISFCFVFRSFCILPFLLKLLYIQYTLKICKNKPS
jgi:hypothetical protein